MPRKRTFDDMVDSDPPHTAQEPTLTNKLRNMWEFSSLHQFIELFGPVLKIQKIDIEDFETECFNSGSSLVIEEIGLQILKWVSSHRGINLENWDEWARRQYQQKDPSRPNPYGDEEEPKHFRDFHIFDKLRTLHQLSVWSFWNPDRIRQAMLEVKETDQFYDWQAHPVGWDRQDRIYYELSNRLYRRTDPPIPERTKSKSKTKPKYTSKKAAAQRRKERASKRRRVDVSDEDTDMNDVDDTVDETQINTKDTEPLADVDPTEVNTFGDYKWECVAISLDEFNQFIASIARSKDPNEHNLKAKIENDMIPELQAVEERRQRKIEARLREIQMAEKMQGAKRSGRLAAKQEKEREEAEAAEAEKQRQTLLQAARREEERQQQLDDDRRSRMLTREQRIKEREYKRILMEEQIARDAEEQERVEQDGARGSRHLKERIEKNRKELEELDEDEWTFDCSGCGKYGKNWDDGQHSIACERCNVWQHSKCLGFTKSAAERDDFHFVCDDCLRKEEAKRPKISLKLKLGNSSSPPQPRQVLKDEEATRAKLVSVDMPQLKPQSQLPPSGIFANGQSHPTPGTTNASFAPAQPVPPQAFQQSLSGSNATQSRQLVPHINGAQQMAHNTSNIYLPDAGVAYAPKVHYQQPLSRPPPHSQQNQQARPASSHSHTSRPTSSQSQMNGNSSPIRQRIPSPMINRPTMSPTQGNPEVGRIVGLPGSSPTLPPAALATPYTNGNRASSYTNGVFPQVTPNQQSLSRNGSFSASQSIQPMSGLSPTKQRISATPIPTPTLVSRKGGSFTTPSSSFNNAQNVRSVSGTPIFPPVENLAPSPHQLNRDPVPTPSKQLVPSPPPLVESNVGQQAPPTFDSTVAQASADRNMAIAEQNERQRYQQQQQGTVQ